MRSTRSVLFVFLPLVFSCVPGAQLPAAGPARSSSISIPLVVSAGAPLRLYITKRLSMRRGGAVEAKLIEPVYAFDRIVIPAGVTVRGRVTALDGVSKMARAQTIVAGDFTPTHFARVQFTEIAMPDGKILPIHTADSEGLPTIYSPPRPSRKPPKAAAPADPAAPRGAIATAKQAIRQQAQQQLEAKARGVIDLVRGPNKKEALEDYAVKRLPYRPQWYRRNTRFDAVLTQPLDFGVASVSTDTLRSVGMPAGESVAEVRLLTDLNSGSTELDAPVNAVLSQPVFSADRRLLLPEGTVLSGHVKKVQRAKWFHRGGQLRFTFDKVEPPACTAAPTISTERSQLLMAAAEADPKANVKVDREGNAKSTESKTRFLAPAVALVLASRAADNDAGRKGTSGASANYGGRTAGGFSGLGMFGSLAAQSSKTFGMALGYYGLGWSVFTNVISRGSEVEFPKNTAIAVRFGSGDVHRNGNRMARAGN